MDEVPPSPEIVKRKKLRRKHRSSFSRLSFQHSERSVGQHIDEEANSPQIVGDTRNSSPQSIPRRIGEHKLSAFYFDDNSQQIETVDTNPLTSAILLEKANAIPAESKVPSPQFVAASNEEFVSVAELAKRSETGQQSEQVASSNVKKQNYSFTQLELDSQMIDMFEAAELLASSGKQVEHPKPEVDCEKPLPTIPRGNTRSKTETIKMEVSTINQIGINCERNIIQTILDDFPEDDGYSWSVDFELIRTERLRQQLRQMQDYIASPPKAVKKEAVCRRYGRANQEKRESAARRLSYYTDGSSSIEHPLTDDEESVANFGTDVAGSDADVTMDGVALNDSVLIQANLTQLSVFFSQANATQIDGEEPTKPSKDSESIDREPTFFGFTPDEPAPISLPLDDAYSPRALRFEFHTFCEDGSGDDSFQSVEDHAIVLTFKCPQMEQLLEDDEDLFMLAHSSEEKKEASVDQCVHRKSVQLTDEEKLRPMANSLTENTVVATSPPKDLVSVCFSTARGGSIRVSEAALLRAGTIFAEEEAKMIADNNNTLGGKEASCIKEEQLDRALLVKPYKPTHDETEGAKELTVTPFVGFSTARGTTIAISEEARAKAKSLFAEEEANVDEVVPDIGHSTTNSSNVKLTANLTSLNAVPNVPSFSGGFNTASGGKISVSKKALMRAQAMFDEEEAKTLAQETLCDGPPAPGGFSTAGGSAITVSESALEKAKLLFVEDDGKGITDLDGVQFLGDRDSKYNSPKKPTSFHNTGDGLKEAKSIRNGVERENEPPPSPNVPQIVGFSSAAGKCLQVSELALSKAKLLFEQDELDMAGENGPANTRDESQRKRKISTSAEEPTTPTKRPRMNHLHSVAGIQTSTPASVSGKTAAGEAMQKRAAIHFATGQEVEQFFAELDDKEFDDIFRHQEQPAVQCLRQTNTLLPKFEQCDEATKAVGEVNTSLSHWDDSFTDILPKLPQDEQPKSSSWPSKEVQLSRRDEFQKQKTFVDAKPDELRRARVSSFCSKKLRKDRPGLQEFVGGTAPIPLPATSPASHVTLANVMEFKFNMIDYYGEPLCNVNTTGFPIGSDGEALLLMDEHSLVGVEEMKLCFLASLGVDPRLVPSGWVENGWRWIVSKLGALERNLNDHFRGALTPENVFHQLQFRYHIEIDSARRSPLRKILEKDDIASRRMVLFVSHVFVVDASAAGYELELSDGWYSLRAVIDVPLAAAVRGGKITIGTKLMIQGGELLNHKDGCSPLEVPPEVRLKIHANSTRRTRWPVKLGYYRCPVPFMTTCNSIHERGGLICRFRALIVRVYPLVYVEKSTNDSYGSTLRSERMQQRHSRRNDASQLDSLHKLYNQIQREIETERTAALPERNIRVTDQTSCSQLQDLLEGGLDVSFLDVELTLSQQAVIKRFQQQQQEELQNEINRRVKAQMDRHSGRSSLSSLLKVRLMDHTTPDRVFMLSIWRPTDSVRCVMHEQSLLELATITANGSKNGEVQLTAHKSSTYKKLSSPKCAEEASLGTARFTRTITPIGNIDSASFRPPFNEFDTVGVVVHVGTSDSKKFQSIYLADTAMELLCVNFWHGLAEYAYEDVVHERAILCVANLQWRTIGRQNQVIAQSFATEYTTFTENPRSGSQRADWDRFQLQLDAIDRDDFFLRCQEKIHELRETMGTPTTGGYGTPNQQRSVSRLQQQQSTPLGTARGSLAKRKMETLSTIYRSPPKLSPIVIRSNPILRKGFKTPARLGENRPAVVDECGD